MQSPKVFIILLNWNNWHETQECLESLNKVRYPDFGVIIVDNNSSLNERQILGKFQFSSFNFQTKVLLNSENLGFAGGNNVGIHYALKHGADYVLLLNNDAVVAPDFLDELMKVAEGNANFGILGSRIYKYKSDEIAFDGGVVNAWLTKAYHAFSLDEFVGQDNAVTYQLKATSYKLVDYITGASMLVRRNVIEKIGLMREEYFLYYEDVDWCIRARKAGFECAVVPTSKVWHKISATNKEGSPSYIYYHTRNRLMLNKFNGNALQRIIGFIVGFFILLKQLPKFILMPSKQVWAKSMTKGVLDFYRGKYGKYVS